MNKLADISRLIEDCWKIKDKKELKNIAEEIQMRKLLAKKIVKERMLSKDLEVIDKTNVMARVASELASKGQGTVRRLQRRLKLMLDGLEARSVGEILPPGPGAISGGLLNLLTGGEKGEDTRRMSSMIHEGIHQPYKYWRGAQLMWNKRQRQSSQMEISEIVHFIQSSSVQDPLHWNDRVDVARRKFTDKGSDEDMSRLKSLALTRMAGGLFDSQIFEQIQLKVA